MTVSEKKQKDYALALHARVTRGVPEKKRQDYAFRHQFDEKPSITPGCPGKAVQFFIAIQVKVEPEVSTQFIGSLHDLLGCCKILASHACPF